MPTIEEQRNKAIAEQIRKMAGMGPEEDDTPSQPVSEKRREKKQETQPATSPQTDYESYQKLFLNPCTIENRVSFSLNRDTIDLLRNILHDLRGKSTLSAYVENILRDHLSNHKESIEKGIEKNRRKPIIL